MRNTIRDLTMDELESVGGGKILTGDAGVVPWWKPGFRPGSTGDLTVLAGMAGGGGSGVPMHAPLQA